VDEEEFGGQFRLEKKRMIAGGRRKKAFVE